MNSECSADPPATPEESPISDRTRHRTGRWHGARPEGVRPAAGYRCEIQLQNPCRYREAGARRVRPWLSPLVAELAPGADSFGVRFVSDREMRQMNSSFRQRDATTDVLSFPAEPSVREALSVGCDDSKEEVGTNDLFAQRHLGDVVISVPTARRQAERLGHSVDVELRILLLHGVLHCLGYDHETDGGVMERLEARLRCRYISDEFSSRAEDGI